MENKENPIDKAIQSAEHIQVLQKEADKKHGELLRSLYMLKLVNSVDPSITSFAGIKSLSHASHNEYTRGGYLRIGGRTNPDATLEITVKFETPDRAENKKTYTFKLADVPPVLRSAEYNRIAERESKIQLHNRRGSDETH